MPFEEEYMRNAFKQLSHQIFKKFETMTKEYADTIQFSDLRNEIAEKMEKDFESKLSTNDELSQNLCKRLINEFFNSFSLPSFIHLEDIKESLLLEYKEKFLLFYDNYKGFAKGVRKCTTSSL